MPPLLLCADKTSELQTRSLCAPHEPGSQSLHPESEEKNKKIQIIIAGIVIIMQIQILRGFQGFYFSYTMVSFQC